MHLDLCERLRLGEWTLSDWRRSYAPGGTLFWLPALKAINQGLWMHGLLLSVVGFEIWTEFADHAPRQLGTLWPDRLVESLADRVARDQAAKPLIRFCDAYSVLQLIPEDRTCGWPCFNVANLNRHPDYLDTWQEHAGREKLFSLHSGSPSR
jgi:hypothetical protein